MEIETLIRLATESRVSLGLLADALKQNCPNCVTEISECHRRCSSALADLHARLFAAFLPPLSRTASAALAEALYAVAGAVFSAAQLLPARTCTGGTGREGELQALCTMSQLLCDASQTLPRFVRGKQPPAPDTYRFYAEQNKARAAHALAVRHTEKTLADRALSDSLHMIAHRLSEAYRALLCLMLESI